LVTHPSQSNGTSFVFAQDGSGTNAVSTATSRRPLIQSRGFVWMGWVDSASVKPSYAWRVFGMWTFFVVVI
jgi:hypothetical protein